MSPRPSTGVRERILDAAQRAIHESGYHGTSVDEILERAGAAKGGFYHHFSDKRAMAGAVIDEKLAELVAARWADDGWHDDPIGRLQAFVRDMGGAQVAAGCPVNALAQEVSTSDPELRDRLASVFDFWIGAIGTGLRQGIARGTVSPAVDATAAASFYLSAIEGLLSIGRTRADGAEFVDRSAGPLLEWLNSLRP